jgi:hypothetical protein
MDYRPCGDGGSLIGKNSRSDSVTKARVMDRRRVGAGQRNVRRGIIASKTGLSAAQPVCAVTTKTTTRVGSSPDAVVELDGDEADKE